MKKKFNKNIFIYGADSKESFDLVKEQRNQFNHNVWTIVSGVATIYFVAMFLSAFFVSVVAMNTILYGSICVLCFVCHVCFRTIIKADDPRSMVLVYILVTGLLLFSIILGEATSPEFLGVTYHVLLICLPLIVVDKPYKMGLIELITGVVFYIVCNIFKTGETRDLDVFNVIVFTLLAQFVNYYMVHSKMQQFITLKKTELSDITDSLTGLNNRKAYAAEMDKIESGAFDDKLVYVAFDVNGLKKANDNLGHSAGDELLIGAADCIRNCFSPFGRTYRIGGDEFTAIIRIDSDKLDTLKASFEQTMKQWKGSYISTMSVSVGYAAHADHKEMSIGQLAKLADELMYEDKELYYKSLEKAINQNQNN